MKPTERPAKASVWRRVVTVLLACMTVSAVTSSAVCAQSANGGPKILRYAKLPPWTVGAYAAGSDGASSLARYDSHQVGGQNMARFRMPEFDELYRRLQVLPDGPERDALFERAQKIIIA
jgi:peptide/nickel transport system substrate-binding protein